MMKYKHFFGLAEPLAELMVESWPAWEVSVDLVVPVPLHPIRRRSRGYNQSELLARHFCKRLNLPIDAKVLQRIRHTRPQVDVKAADRLANVAGAYRAKRGNVEGKQVLLIDDVCTTGSTLSEAAKALLAAGAKTVSGYCLARAT